MNADERAALKQRFDNMTKGELVIALLTAHERLDEMYTLDQVLALVEADTERRLIHLKSLETKLRKEYEQRGEVWASEFRAMWQVVTSMYVLFTAIDKDAGYSAIPQAHDRVKAGLMGKDLKLSELYDDLVKKSAALGLGPLPVIFSAHVAARIEAIKRAIYHRDYDGLLECADVSGSPMIAEWFEAMPDYKVGGQEGFRAQLYELVENARKSGKPPYAAALFEHVRKQLEAQNHADGLEHTWEYRALDKLNAMHKGNYEGAERYLSEIRRAAKEAERDIKSRVGEHVHPQVPDVID